MFLNFDFFLKKDIFSFFIKDLHVIHFIGIGGCGMSGIAEILVLSGYRVTGSDIKMNDRISYLISLGVKVYLFHSESNVYKADIVVYSASINMFNLEIIYAKKNKIPLFKRVEFLFELIKYDYIISVMGSHGKTTTTAIMLDLFLNNGIEVNCINGGYMKSVNSYVYLGNSNYSIIELDESNNSFLFISPLLVILTNIDNDHICNYFNSVSNLVSCILKFLNKVPSYGYIVLCKDNKLINNLLLNNSFKCNVITYGFDSLSDLCILNYYQYKYKSYFTLRVKNQYYNLVLNMFGKHNILNSVAALSFFLYKDLMDIKLINKTLKNFLGVSNRTEFIGSFFYKNSKNILFKNIYIISDYGHHPNEIYSCILSLRENWKNVKIIMVFEPHRFTRMKSLFNDFISVLIKVDILLILNIYSANENFIKDVSSKNLLFSMYDIGFFSSVLVSNFNDISFYLLKLIKDNIIILFQGAGDIHVIRYDFVLKFLFG